MGHIISFIKERDVNSYRDKNNCIRTTKEKSFGYEYYSFGTKSFYDTLEILGLTTKIYEYTINLEQAKDMLAKLDNLSCQSNSNLKSILLNIIKDITEPSIEGFLQFCEGITKKDWTYKLFIC